MHSALARHERMHVAVPRCSGAAAWAGIVTLLDMRESAISLNAIVSWSFCCLVAPASRTCDRDCRDARGERSSVLSVRGVSQEGEDRALRVIASSILIVRGHRVAESHAFLYSGQALTRHIPVVLPDHLLTARRDAPAQCHWPARRILRLVMGLSWAVCRQVCVDMTSIAQITFKTSCEPCIRRPKGRRLLDGLLGEGTPQPKHALMHGDLMHRESFIEMTPLRQGPHVTALRVLCDEVAALLHLD